LREFFSRNLKIGKNIGENGPVFVSGPFLIELLTFPMRKKSFKVRTSSQLMAFSLLATKTKRGGCYKSNFSAYYKPSILKVRTEKRISSRFYRIG